jgi:hypothetical protein
MPSMDATAERGPRVPMGAWPALPLSPRGTPFWVYFSLIPHASWLGRI